VGLELKMKQCEHFSQETKSILNSQECEECKNDHMPTVALRMCLICGHVGCCDSSVGQHATKHFKETGHPIMQAVPDKSWKWCYIHDEYY
jgi:uncharacterized UBP type Zn finger protein